MAHTSISGSVLFLTALGQLAASSWSSGTLLRAADVAGGEFLGFAHVDHHRALAVDELHGALGRERRRRGALRTSGQASMPPELSAIRISIQLSTTNFTIFLA